MISFSIKFPSGNYADMIRQRKAVAIIQNIYHLFSSRFIIIYYLPFKKYISKSANIFSHSQKCSCLVFVLWWYLKSKHFFIRTPLGTASEQKRLEEYGKDL